MTRPVGSPSGEDALILGVGGGARIRYSGLALLGDATRSWVRGALEPLADDGGVDVDVDVAVVVTAVEPVRPDLISHGVALHPRGVWIGDRPGDGGVLSVRDGVPVIEVAPGINATTLRNPIHTLAAKIALWRHGATLVRLAAVDLDGYVVALAGGSGAGKTVAVLEMLRRGGRLLGDSVVALTPDGRLAPALADAKLRRPPSPVRAGLSDRIAVASRGGRGRPSRMADRVRRAGLLLAEIVAWEGHTYVGVGGLGSAVGRPGPPHVLALLRPRPEPDPVRFVLASGASFFAVHHTVSRVVAALDPRGPSLLPDEGQGAEALERAVAAARVREVPTGVVPGSAGRVIDEILSP